MSLFAEKIIPWYKENGRDLPWRNTTDPYKIWISEIILQQTRVVQGYEYYCRFIKRFPNVHELACADMDEVMKYWQGLGYYSRARNLHEAAKQIVALGSFPKSYEEVRALKGVGDYTAAAICSFAYGLPCAVVDGNVYRVLSRWMAIEEPIDTAAGKRLFVKLAGELLDNLHPAEYNQAIMDFGALQCVPVSPVCERCPLSDSCMALQLGKVTELPKKSHKIVVTRRYFHYLYIHTDTHVFLHKRGAGDIWHNLYEFPLIETDDSVEEDELLKLPACKSLLSECCSPCWRKVSQPVKHVLSHRVIYADCYDVTIHSNEMPVGEYLKVGLGDFDKFPVSRLISRFFSLILKQNIKEKEDYVIE